MGNRYTVDIDLTPTGGNDVLTIVSPANRRVRPVQVIATGRGTTSAAQGLDIVRSTGGTTGGGAITPSKADHSEQPAAASTVNTTWSVQPTVEGNAVRIGWNAIGGGFAYNVPKGMLEARNGENLSIRAPSGFTFQACTVSVVYEED